MIVLLLGSIALVFVYEATDPASPLRRTYELVDLGLVIFFVAEWLWRVWSNKEGRAKYAARYSWELLGMVPLLLPVPAFLRSLRILRVVRILRVFNVVGKDIGVWERIAKKSGLKKIGIAAAGITFVGALLVWLLERDVDGGNFDSLGEAVWWAIVTVTTVGYGDITPVTPMGRFVATILMVTGIGIIGLLASSLASVLIEEDEEEAAASDLATNLQSLARLHSKGKLTDDEFSQAKAKLLE